MDCVRIGLSVGLLVLGLGCGEDTSDEPTLDAATGDAGTPDDPDANVAADTSPPAVLFSSPMSGEVAVASNTSIVVFFSEAMNPSTITTSSFTLSTGGDLVVGSVTSGATAATFHPGAMLAPGTTYTASLTTQVTDEAGNGLAAAHSWSFTTAAPMMMDTTPPSVLVRVPLPDTTGAPLSSTVSVTFDEPIDTTTLTGTNFTLHQVGGGQVAGIITAGLSGATFAPSSALAAETEYEARVETGVTDLAGNALAMQQTWRFTTAAAPDTTPPSVAFTLPPGMTDEVILNAPVTVFFNEDIDPSTVNSSSFTLRPYGGGSLVMGTVSVGASSANFIPDAPLAVDTIYEAEVTTAVQDLAGNALAADYSWIFMTEGGRWESNTGADGVSAMRSIYNLDVAMRDNGDAVLVFVIDNSGMTGQELHAVRFSAGGGSVVDGMILAAPIIGRAQALYDSSGNIHVAYTSGSSETDLFEVVYNGSWQSPVTIADTAQDVFDIEFGIDDSDNLLVVFEQATGGPQDIRWSSRAIAGSWSSPLALSGGGDSFGPTLSVSASGDAIAGWIEPDPSMMVNSAYVSRFNGTSWTGPVLLESNDSDACLEIDVAMDSVGNAVVGWIQNRDSVNGDDVQLRRYDSTSNFLGTGTSPGAGWAATAVHPDDTDEDAENVHVGLTDGGTAYAAWVERFSMIDTVFRADSAGHGMGWGSIETVSESGGVDDMRMEVHPDGRAAIGWISNPSMAGYEFRIQHRRGGGWATPENLGPGRDMGTAYISLGLTGDGRAIAAWRENSVDITVATYE